MERNKEALLTYLIFLRLIDDDDDCPTRMKPHLIKSELEKVERRGDSHLSLSLWLAPSSL